MNKVSLIGNIVNDLELKDYKNGDKEGKYVRFTLAINEYNIKKNERIATFIEVVAFDKKAIILAHNVGKGSKLAVEGRLQTSNYLNSEGERRYKVDIVLNEFTFIDNNKRKSIPIDYFNDKGYILKEKLQPRVDYLEIIDQIYGGIL